MHLFDFLHLQGSSNWQIPREHTSKVLDYAFGQLVDGRAEAGGYPLPEIVSFILLGLLGLSKWQVPQEQPRIPDKCWIVHLVIRWMARPKLMANSFLKSFHSFFLEPYPSLYFSRCSPSGRHA